MNKKGFTLIELVMVIVIIGILAAIAIPRFVDLRRDARQAACLATAGAIRGALSTFYASTALRTSTPHFPKAATFVASVQAFMQTAVGTPNSGAWTNYYNGTTGVVTATNTAGGACK